MEQTNPTSQSCAATTLRQFLRRQPLRRARSSYHHGPYPNHSRTAASMTLIEITAINLSLGKETHFSQENRNHEESTHHADNQAPLQSPTNTERAEEILNKDNQANGELNAQDWTLEVYHTAVEVLRYDEEEVL